MTNTLYVRRQSDGEVRQMSMDDFGSYTGDFVWSEGNFACDCNRGQFFAQAGGIDTDAMTDEEDGAAFPCGDGRYLVRIVDGSGRELYADADWTEGPR